MIFRFKVILISFWFSSISISNSKALTASAIDSIGVERNGDKIFILHKVFSGETLFSISRKYQVSVEELLSGNEILKKGLKSGQTIRVPRSGLNSSEGEKSIHKVVSGETLFSISKKYGVTVQSLQAWNNLKNSSLKAGQTLVISESSAVIQQKTNESVSQKASMDPVSTVSTEIPSNSKVNVGEKKVIASSTKLVEVERQSEIQKANPSNPSNPVDSTVPSIPEWTTHTVKSGETLFSLSNEYGKSVEELIKWNSLSSNNLKSGQILKVGRKDEIEKKSLPVAPVKNSVASAEIKIESIPQNTSGGFKNIIETGMAQLIEGSGDHKKYLVLHREAPIGSVIRVKNEENNLTIFARVVGKLPDTGDNSKLLIKLSQAAYDQLKSVNQRFPVEILY
jgi:LysM repeat protein